MAHSKDPISILPTELLLQVFHYLPVLNVWSLKLVSKRWHNLLSSREFTHDAVARWETHDSEDSASVPEPTGTDRIDRKLQHIKNMKTKTYEWCKILDASSCAHDGRFTSILLKSRCKGSKIAYVSSEAGRSCNVVIHDLVSGEERIVRGYAQERVDSIVLTTVLVAWTTYNGWLYVSYHDKPTDDVTRVPLPFQHIHRGEGDGELLVFVERDRDHDDHESFGNILLYHAQAQRFQTIEVPFEAGLQDADYLGHRLVGCTLHLERQLGFIHLFFVAMTTSDGLISERSQDCRELMHARIAFDGTCVQRRHRVNLDSAFDLGRPVHLRLSRVRSTGLPDQFGFRIYDGSLRIDKRYRRRARLLFDAEKNDVCSVPSISRSDAPYHETSQAFLMWKGESYYPGTPENWVECGSLINNSFLVTVEARADKDERRGRIRAYCFDPNVPMPKDGHVDDGQIAAEFMKPRTGP